MKNNILLWLKNPFVILFIILFLSCGLRFYHLADNPSGLFRDEADKGYTTYSIVKTGADQTGKPYPLYVRSLKVTTSSLYQYLDIPFVASLGLNELAVRLPSCIAGLACAVITFIIAWLWWGNSLALWAALFVGLSPWSVLLSRWANQSNLLTVSIPLAILFFYKAMSNKQNSFRNCILSCVFFLTAIYTYEPAQMFVPVILVVLWLLALRHTSFSPDSIKLAMVFFVLFLLGCIPFGYHVLFEQRQSFSRLSSISIFDGQPLFLAMLEFAKNYLLHISPDFLFLHGDQNLRHNPVGVGQEQWMLFPLFLFGFIRAIRKRQFIDQILLAWFLCFPVAASCTRESVPHALRSVFAVPVLQLLAAYGIMECRDYLEKLQSRFSSGFLSTLRYSWISFYFLFSLIFVFDLFCRYPVYAAVDWEYGYRDAMQWWQKNKQDGDLTVVSGLAEYPQAFFLFYNHYPPEKWVKEQQIEGITFVPTGQAPDKYYVRGDRRVLFLLRPMEFPALQAEKVICLPSGEAVWKWVILNKKQP